MASSTPPSTAVAAAAAASGSNASVVALEARVRDLEQLLSKGIGVVVQWHCKCVTR